MEFSSDLLVLYGSWLHLHHMIGPFMHQLKDILTQPPFLVLAPLPQHADLYSISIDVL